MFDSVATRVARHALERPGQEAAVIIDGERREMLTYGGLDQAARRVAGWLAEHCSPGDRALLLYPTGAPFVAALLGCLYAGVTAVPAPLPTGPDHHLALATGIAVDAGARAVLTDATHLASVVGWLSQDGLGHLPTAATDGAGPSPDGSWQPDVDAGAAAWLHYTFGGTEPRGVMVSQGNLLHNLGLIGHTLDLRPGTRVGGWLPLHHDMGLVGVLLASLLHGGTAVAMSPSTFFDSPCRWLRLIDEDDLLVTVAPGSAYDWCARSVTDRQIRSLDLSRLRFALVGSEPVDACVMDRFTRRFARAGFRPEAFVPWYGLAEMTSFVSAARPGRGPVVTEVSPRALEHDLVEPAHPGEVGVPLVSIGAARGLGVLVVSPGGAELPDGRVGEVWIRGGSKALGYWRREIETRHHFDAETTTGQRGFLRSGDLGVRLGGELYVLGPIDDMLVVDGRRLHPRDIEREVDAVYGWFDGAAGSVFAVPAPHDELVLVQEVDERQPAADLDLPALAMRMRAAIARSLGVCIANVAFLRPGRERQALSGTARRTLMRSLFMADALDPLHEELTAVISRRYRPASVALARGAAR